MPEKASVRATLTPGGVPTEDLVAPTWYSFLDKPPIVDKKWKEEITERHKMDSAPAVGQRERSWSTVSTAHYRQATCARSTCVTRPGFK